MRGLDPPPEVQDAHEDFVRTDAEDLAFQRTRNELAASAGSAADFVELSARHDEENRGDLIDRLVDSCLALQQIADENDIDEDLMCGE